MSDGGVHDRGRFDVKSRHGVTRAPRFDADLMGATADRADQLAALVRDEPSIEAAARFCGQAAAQPLQR